MNSEEVVDFCIGKCGEGYCSAMSGKGGYPCVEFICMQCKADGIHESSFCEFCMGKRP